MKKRIIAILLTGMMALNNVPVYAEGNMQEEDTAYSESLEDGFEGEVAAHIHAESADDSSFDVFSDEENLAGNDWVDAPVQEESGEDTNGESTGETENPGETEKPEETEEPSRGTLATGVKWELSEDGKLHFTGSGAIIKDEESGDGEESVYPWNKSKVFLVEIEKGITEIGSGAFADCTELTKVSIGADTLEKVSEDAFTNSSLENVELYYSGNAPAALPVFQDTAAVTVYYQEINQTWTEEYRSAYKNVNWIFYCYLYGLNAVTEHHYVRDSNEIIIQIDGNTYPTQENMAYYNTTCTGCQKKSREYNECIHCIDTAELQSDHPYNTETTTDWTVSMQDAEEIILTFDERTQFETNYDDFFYIYDENGELYQKYINDQLAGKTVVVPGSSVTLRLTTDYSTDEWGFAITKAFGTTHEWNSVVTIPARRDQTGILTRICQKCGEEIEEVIPAPYMVCGDEGDIFWGITPDHVLEISANNGNTASISGYGAQQINGHEVTAAPWGTYEANIEGLRVKKGITSIGWSSFCGMSKLKWAEFDDDIETIYNMAFQNCSVLEKISLPKNITTIEYAAFSGTALKSVHIPGSLKICRDNAFGGYDGTVRTVYIEDLSKWLQMEEGPEFPFQNGVDFYVNGELLENVVIPEYITHIRRNAFYNGKSIKTVTFHEKIESIEAYAFAECKNLELSTDKLPNYLVSIGDCAFRDCKKISKVAIPSSVVNIGTSAFEGCESLTQCLFANDIQLEKISSRMFVECKSLEKISIPSRVTAIGSEAFWECSNLKKVEFKEDSKLKNIERYAFNCDYALENIKIPAGVTAVEDWAFGYCNALDEIIFLGDFPNLELLFGDGGKIVKISYYACNDTWNSSAAQNFLKSNNNFYTITANPIHMSAKDTTITPATCTSDGERSFVCDNCNQTFTEVIPSPGHDLTLKEHKAATCVEKGYDIHVCSVCKEEFTTELEIDADAHQYDAGEVVEATCFREGYTVYTCALCGNVKRDNYTQTTPHAYEDLIVKSTCQTNGYTRHQCKNCGTFYDDTWTEPLEHAYESTVTAPTCTERGYTYYSCKNCGYSYTDHYVGATGHMYKKEVIQPTCTEKGYTKNTCNACGLSYISNYKEATGHDYEIVVTAPTCTKEGYTTSTCKTCANVVVSDYRSMLGHSYQAERTDSTCTAEGFTTYTCVTCGNRYVGDQTDKAPHKWDSGTVTKEATYLESGCKEFKCEDCDASYTEDIPALEQTDLSDCTITLSYRKTVYNGKEKTPKIVVKTSDRIVNTEDYTVVYADNQNAGEAKAIVTANTGNVCITGEVEIPFVIEKAKQNVTAEMAAESVHVNTQEPVTVNGLGEVSIVSENEEIAEVTEENLILGKKKGNTFLKISVAGDDNHEAAETRLPVFVNEDHIFKITDTVASTCSTKGSVTSVCELCEKTVTEEKELDLIHGHTYAASVVEPTCTEAGYTLYTCQECGDVYTDHYRDAAGHDYTVEKTEPTCTEKGYKTYTCKKCGKTKLTDYKEATGHTYKEEVTKPTCTEKGYTTYTCTVCGAMTTEDYREPLNHTYEKEVTPSSCTKKGFTTYTCTRCGNHYTGDETEILSHRWDNGTTTKEATYLENGIQTFKCADCGAVYTKDIPALEQTDLGDCTIALSWRKTVYDGKEKKPEVTVQTSDRLVSAEDYTVVYVDNRNAGEAKVIVTAKAGNVCITGDVEIPFVIEKARQNITAEMAAESVHAGTQEVITVNGLGEISIVSENEEIAEVTEENHILGKKEGTAYLKISASGDDNHEAAQTRLEIFVDEDHVFQITDSVASTCSVQGSVTLVCELCQKTVTEKKDLDLVNGHDDIMEKTEPTCTEKGYRTYTCKNCGRTKITDYEAAKGHIYEKEVTEPTCTQRGYTTYTCTVCGAVSTEDYREPLNHIYEKKVTPSSCTAEGFTTYTCKRCQNSYTGDETDKTPHRWDNGTITKKASYLDNGIKEFKCSDCAATYTKDIPALGQTDLGECAITLSYYKTVYNGKEKTPEVLVKTGDGVVSEDDYTVTYADNKNAGTAKVIVTAREGDVCIKGKTEISFVIAKARQTFVASCAEERIHINVETPIQINGGVGTLSLTTNDTDLIEIKGSRIVGKKAGLALIQATISGDANHEAASSTAAVWLDANHIIKKAVENRKTLGNGDVEYDDVQKCTICGTVLKRNHKSLKNLNTEACEIRLSASVYVFEGGEIRPNVSVFLSGKALTEGKDYRLEYKNNDHAGDASVSVVGMGNYTNTKEKTFRILAALETPEITSVENASKGLKLTWKKTDGVQGYIIYRASGNGAYKEIKTIADGAATAYVDVTATVNGEKYTYAVSGYTGNVKSKYAPKSSYCLTAPRISSVKNNASKKLTVKWKKNAKATGYQVNYKTGSKEKTVTVKSNKKLSTVLKSLKKGATYSVKVRSYKSVSGTTYYSEWSPAKKVKIKK